MNVATDPAESANNLVGQYVAVPGKLLRSDAPDTNVIRNARVAAFERGVHGSEPLAPIGFIDSGLDVAHE